MSMTFTKLFSSITESTIWLEPNPTRIVWIAMLAMADKRGRVWGSIPGIANRARVTTEEAREAISCFLSPDPDSRTKDHEGRRIVEIDGGWQLLNYTKYREMRDDDSRREYMREYMASKRQKLRKVSNVSKSKPPLAQAEAEAEADHLTPNGVMSGKPDVARPVSQKDKAREILAFLNQKAGRAYQDTDTNLNLIVARLKEGYDEDMCRAVIVRKCREWKADDKMTNYLRPATLFNREKFNQYAGECVA